MPKQQLGNAQFAANMIAILVCLSSLYLTTRAGFVNNYDQEFRFQCPTETQTVSYIYSVHSNSKEDRQFNLACRDFLSNPNGRTTDCFWTNFQNTFDHLVHFSCPTSHFINGMGSRHDNRYEDRIWRFYCCHIEDVHFFDCGFTGWTNQYDAVQDFTLATNKVLTGSISQHNNQYEDRQYEYEFCRFQEIDDNEIGGIIG